MKRTGRLVEGPWTRGDGTRFWVCRVGARNRLRIPEEIVTEQDWQDGDRLELDVEDHPDGTWAIHVRNPDALARRGRPFEDRTPAR